MKITAFTSAWNCSKAGLDSLIDWYLNHLKVDKFIYADNFSTDNTKEFLLNRFKLDDRLVIIDTPYLIFSDDKVAALANTLMVEDDCDAFIWVDSDEIIYHPELREFLNKKKQQGKYFISCFLTNVYNDNDSFNPNVPIIDNFELCYKFEVQKTPIIIKSPYHEIKFLGGHHAVNYDGVIMEIPVHDVLDKIILFHFCYITQDFFIERKTNPKNHLRYNGVLFDAIADDGWWSRTLERQQQCVLQEKENAVNIKDFVSTELTEIYYMPRATNNEPIVTNNEPIVTTKITAFTTAWNCRNSGVIDLIDYYLNVIKVDRFIYLDDHSNDGTIDCIRGYYSMYDNSIGCIGDDPRLRIADVPYDCYSEQNAMKAANILMHLDDSDVFIWVDSDEYLYHPTRNVRDIIEEERYAGKNYITTRLTNVYNETNTYNDSKTLLSQVDLYHQHNREYGSAKTPVIIKDKTKKIVYGGSNHFCIIDYKVFIDDYDEIPNTLYLLHTCYLTDQFYIDRKVNAKKRLQSHNIYITALDDETGWWSKSIEDQRQSVIKDKLHAKSAHEFFE